VKLKSLITHASLLLILLLAITPLGEPIHWSESNATRLTDYYGFDLAPSVAALKDGTTWVLWQSDQSDIYCDIWYRIYNGTYWSSAKQLITSLGADVQPFITQISDGSIWVVWSSDRTSNYDIFCQTSTDNGKSWSTPKQLTTNPARDINPYLAQLKDGSIWVVWSSNRTGNLDIFYKSSVDKGANWSTETQLTTSTHNDKVPSIAEASDGSVWIVWGGDPAGTGNYDIYAKISKDKGKTWSSLKQLTINFRNDLWPTILQASDGGIRLFWQSDRRDYRGVPQSDLYYKTSYDNGLTWSNDTQLTADVKDDEMPRATQIRWGEIGLVWVSNRYDNWDIFYGTITYRDAAVIHVAQSSILGRPVYEGETITVNVTVQNQGIQEENPLVYTYYSLGVIGYQSTAIKPGNSKTLTFTWNTSKVAPGSYEIIASVNPVIGEDDLHDNTLIDGTVNVRKMGDVNGDGKVNVQDLLQIATAYGTKIGDPGYNPAADLNLDGSISILDLLKAASNYGG